MRYDLATLTRRAKNPRRPSIRIRDTRPPSTFAGDLYRSAYKPVVDIWAEAVAEIMAEYERTIAMTQDAPADIEAKLEQAERRFSLLSLTITPAIERWALRVEQWTRGRWRAAVLSATNVDIGTMIGPVDVKQTLDAAINWNVSLVKDVSAEARRRMSAIIYDGLRGNKPAREVAKELRVAVDLGRARSVRIASDQLAKITSALADERRREAGIDSWIWMHSGKQNGRDDHVARNGKEYSDANPPPEMPGQLPFCGCRQQSVVKFDDIAAVPQAQQAAEPVAAAVPLPTPKPLPVPKKQAGFQSPVNPDVTDETIVVRKKSVVQKEMSADLAKAAQHPQYSQVPEFRNTKADQFGKASFSSEFKDETVSMISAIKPELDNLSAQIGIPPIRGFKSTSRQSANASMGDGIMTINPLDFNARASRVGNRTEGEVIGQLEAEKTALRSQLDQKLAELRAIESQLYSFENWLNDPRSPPLMDRRKLVAKEHEKLRLKFNKVSKQQGRASYHNEPIASWKPGDDEKARPWSVAEYQSGINRARSTMYHEFAHHIHQMLNKKGPRREFGRPPLEKDLPEYYQRAMSARAGRQPSKYSTTNAHEWFAENFAAYAMKRVDLVDPVAKELIEDIFNGTYGKN